MKTISTFPKQTALKTNSWFTLQVKSFAGHCSAATPGGEVKFLKEYDMKFVLAELTYGCLVIDSFKCCIR